MSGARTWVVQHMGLTCSFDSFEVKQMFAAVDNTNHHVPCPAYPLSSSHIKMVCDYFDAHSQISLAIKPCILIGYSCFLRACNLLSPSTQIWKGSHTMLVSDIVTTQTGLVIYLRSSKTFTERTPKFINVCKVSNPKYCPVVAWNLYRSVVNPCPCVYVK